MSNTVPIVESFETSAKVICVSSGDHLAYGQINGQLFIDNNEIQIDGITGIGEFTSGDLLVSSSIGLQCLRGTDCVWSLSFESGIESINVGSEYAIAIDGIGYAHLVNSKGESMKLDCSSVTHAIIKNRIAIATDDGQVITYSLKGDKEWKRPMRGDIGETITAIGWDSNNLIVAREGHGLVPGEEEALEVETWHEGKLLSRSDSKQRVISIDGGWRGLDMGGITLHGELIVELQHPVHSLIDFGEYCLAGSWFHIYRVNKSGIEWSVETTGMVEHISSNKSGSRVLIAGEDQNDFTDSEPVILIDSNAKPVPIIEEETTLDDWGEAAPIEITAEELYGSEISIEELAGTTGNTNFSDDSILLDALNDDVESVIIEEDEEDLMLSLSSDAETIIAPTPDAGGDQQVSASEDGTAIVTLDGTSTKDPQERITIWSWVDSTGREIGESSKLRVKLNLGVHRFELRIRDKDGRWSSDSIDVRVV